MFTVIFCSWEAKIKLLDNSNSLFLLEKHFVEEYIILSSYKYNENITKIIVMLVLLLFEQLCGVLPLLIMEEEM